jgi:hypothetical protein
LDKKKRVVTATVNTVSGVTYQMTAKLGLTAKIGRTAKTGTCKVKGAKTVCTLAPGSGKWTFSVTPQNAGGIGTANVKVFNLAKPPTTFTG